MRPTRAVKANMKIWSEKVERDGKQVKVWCADFTLHGRRYRPREDSKADLEEAIDALRTRARQEKYSLPVEQSIVTLHALIAARRADPERQRMPTYPAAERELQSFRDFFTHDFAVTALTTAALKDYVTRRCASVSPGTVNRKLGYVSSMLHAAGDYFAPLESWRPPRFPFMKEPEERQRPLALDEAQRIVAWLLTAPVPRKTDRVAREKVADIFRLALMTSTRQGEWRLRRWGQVDFANGLIQLTKTKTGKSRTLVMTAPVRAILQRRFAACNGSEYVFPGAYKHQQPMRENSIRHLLQAAAKALSITYGRNNEGGFVFHDTRHTAASTMLLAGHDLATVADVLGHSKKEMTLKYAHATIESRRGALTSLEKFGYMVEIDPAGDKILTSENGADGKQ